MATGQDLLTRAKFHIGQKYVLGAVVPLSNPNWKGPWDCAEFVSWCVYQESGIIYGCEPPNPGLADAYTGYWDRDSRTLGELITVAEALRIPGAALLRRPPAAGKPGHIAFSDGEGGTVEARSAALGVCTGVATGRPWDCGVLVPQVVYATNLAPVHYTPPAFAYRYQSPNLRGTAVEQIQRALRKRGIDPGPADGIFGPQTDAAVRSFQAMRGLTPDGVVGPETAGRLGLVRLGEGFGVPAPAQG